MRDENATAATRTQASIPVQHLDQKHLAERWQISARTLEHWRWKGQGPRYLKIGGRVVYRLADVEAFETSNLHANTNGPLAQYVGMEAAHDRR